MVVSWSKPQRTVCEGGVAVLAVGGSHFFNPNFLPLVGLGDPMLVYIKLISATSSIRINHKNFFENCDPPRRPKTASPPVGEKLWYPLLVVLVVVE